jgi:single-stranded DNA-binding protein
LKITEWIKIVFYAKMAARISSGSRGGKVLIYEGFKYQKNRERGEIIHSSLPDRLWDMSLDYN